MNRPEYNEDFRCEDDDSDRQIDSDPLTADPVCACGDPLTADPVCACGEVCSPFDPLQLNGQPVCRACYDKSEKTWAVFRIQDLPYHGGY